MEKHKVTPKQAASLAKWERFLEVQLGAYPATMAAIALRMSPQGVYQASERGHLIFFQVGRVRWYGRKDVLLYKELRSRRFDLSLAGRVSPVRNFSA